MSQVLESQITSASDLVEFFQSQIQLHSPGASGSYRKALARLLLFVRGRGTLLLELSAATLCDWWASMVADGLSAKTASHYLDVAAALYSAAAEAGCIRASSAFAVAKKEIRQSAKIAKENVVNADDFSRLLSLSKSAASLQAPLKVYAEILVLMLQSGRSLSEAVMLRRSDIDTLPEECRELARRNSSNTRSYIFPLRQSLTTPARVAAAAEAELRRLLLSRNLPVIGSVDETVRSFRAYAALQCGADASAAVSLVGGCPKGMASLSICTSATLSAAELETLSSRVADIFQSTRLRWFVMRIRPRVRINQLEARFRQIKGEVVMPEIFYPSREITRRVGKKLITEQRPVIPDIIFFRCRLAEIAPLFRHIGDLAWCYTTGRGVGSTYAAIPAAAMETFQRTIGKFTPDFEVAPQGALHPRPGERVVVIGGLFEGLEAEIEKVEQGSSGLIYRLNIIDGQGVEWRISLDSRLTTPS